MGIFDMFSNKNERQARNDQITGLNLGRTKAFGNLNTGEQQIRGQYGAADDFYQPYADRSETAARTYSDALGLNGAAGNASATGAFRAGPGYQFGVDEALKGVLRNSSATGNLASGNTLIALQKRGNDLADQEYGGWLDRLGGLEQQGVGIAGARAGISTGLGDRLLGLNEDRAGINWGAETGIGNAQAQYQLGKDKTSSNIFGAITGGLKLGAQLMGMGGTGGGM